MYIKRYYNNKPNIFINNFLMWWTITFFHGRKFGDFRYVITYWYNNYLLSGSKCIFIGLLFNLICQLSFRAIIFGNKQVIYLLFVWLHYISRALRKKWTSWRLINLKSRTKVWWCSRRMKPDFRISMNRNRCLILFIVAYDYDFI